MESQKWTQLSFIWTFVSQKTQKKHKKNKKTSNSWGAQPTKSPRIGETAHVIDHFHNPESSLYTQC